ncbi:hypothetical protein [Azospirillum argentinense]
MTRFKKLYTDVMFCDDFRSEVGNKISVMGVYAEELVLDKLPVVIPTFGVLVSLASDEPDIFDGMEIIISTKGTEEVVPIDPATIERAKAAMIDMADTIKKKSSFLPFRFSVNITISPLRIIEYGAVNVTVKTDAGKFPAGALIVKERAKEDSRKGAR